MYLHDELKRENAGLRKLLENEKLKNEEPEKAYKGSFNIRVSPELHKQAAICAMAQQVSLNTLVEDALREYVAERKEAV